MHALVQGGHWAVGDTAAPRTGRCHEAAFLLPHGRPSGSLSHLDWLPPESCTATQTAPSYQQVSLCLEVLVHVCARARASFNIPGRAIIRREGRFLSVWIRYITSYGPVRPDSCVFHVKEVQARHVDGGGRLGVETSRWAHPGRAVGADFFSHVRDGIRRGDLGGTRAWSLSLVPWPCSWLYYNPWAIIRCHGQEAVQVFDNLFFFSLPSGPWDYVRSGAVSAVAQRPVSVSLVPCGMQSSNDATPLTGHGILRCMACCYRDHGMQFVDVRRQSYRIDVDIRRCGP